MKTVIEMAREAGYTEGELAWHDEILKRFAELVRADERARMAEQPARTLEELHAISREISAEQSAQQEPVATLWQHGETGRTRITMPDDIADCDARWFKAADLYTSPPAQRKPLTDEQIVAKALHLSGLGTSPDVIQFARAIEAAHNIKENT